MGVPLFKSEDLVNWKQLGHVLIRETKVKLDNVSGSAERYTKEEDEY